MRRPLSCLSKWISDSMRTYLSLSFKSFSWCSHQVLLFFPRGDVSDLDQPCLSSAAGHKGPQGKLFILTSFQENKPCTLWASVPRRVQKTQPLELREQLSLRGHDLSPGSGYRHRGAAEVRDRPGASLLPRSRAVSMLVIANSKFIGLYVEEALAFL